MHLAIKNRWLILAAVIAILGGTALLLLPRVTKRAEQKRRLDYQRKLDQYAEALRPGQPRSEVEAFIKSKQDTFKQMCCVRTDKNAWDDVIKIGEETSPTAKWPCTATDVLVAFEFNPNEPRSKLMAADSDKLVAVSLFEQPQPCL